MTGVTAFIYQFIIIKTNDLTRILAQRQLQGILKLFFFFLLVNCAFLKGFGITSLKMVTAT